MNPVTLNFSGNLFRLLEFTLHTRKLLSFLGHAIKIVFLLIQQHFLSAAGDSISSRDKGYQMNAQSYRALLTPFTGASLNESTLGRLRSAWPCLMTPLCSTVPLCSMVPLCRPDRCPQHRSKRRDVYNSCHVSVCKNNCIGWEQCSQQGPKCCRGTLVEISCHVSSTEISTRTQCTLMLGRDEGIFYWPNPD